MKILVLFAHPALQKSKVNVALVKAIKNVSGITFHDLYEAYPDFNIDVPFEQKLLKEHDVIVFQHPFYWYSTPSIIKEWFDLVLEYGYAYGEGGDKLKGKLWLSAITAGGPEAAYQKTGHNRFTVKELLAPIEQTAYLCGMNFLEPFVIHSSLKLTTTNELETVAQKYKDYLIKLRDQKNA